MRRALLFVHRWLGLTGGVVFAIAALTGSIMVYADDLDVLLDGAPSQTQSGFNEPDAISAAVQRALPLLLAMTVTAILFEPAAMRVANRLVNGANTGDWTRPRAGDRTFLSGRRPRPGRLAARIADSRHHHDEG